MGFAVIPTCQEHGGPENECAECVAYVVLARADRDLDALRGCLALAAVGAAMQRIADYRAIAESMTQSHNRICDLVARDMSRAFADIVEALGLGEGE